MVRAARGKPGFFEVFLLLHKLKKSDGCYGINLKDQMVWAAQGKPGCY